MSNGGALIVLAPGTVAAKEALPASVAPGSAGLYIEMEGARLAIGPRHLINDDNRAEIRRLWPPGNVRSVSGARAVSVAGIAA